MKIIKLELAKILAELPNWIDQVDKWEDLPYHAKLGYICEAERVIKALAILEERQE